MTESTAISNSFSLSRLRLIWDFYYPTVRLPILIYPPAAIVITAAGAVLYQSVIGLLFSSLLSLAFAAAIYFFPLFFCRIKSPVSEAMLPVTAGERLTYFILITLLVPILLGQVPAIITSNIIKSCFDITPIFEGAGITSNMGGKLSLFSISQQLPPLFTCLFVVITCHRNRVGLSIASVICMLILLGVMGFVTSYLYVIGTGDITSASESIVEEKVTEVFENCTWIFISLASVYSLIILSVAYYRIKRSQL